MRVESRLLSQRAPLTPVFMRVLLRRGKIESGGLQPSVLLGLLAALVVGFMGPLAWCAYGFLPVGFVVPT